MTNNINAPKKPFPIAGVFLLAYMLSLIAIQTVSTANYVSILVEYGYEAFSPLDIIGYFLDVAFTYVTAILAALLGIVLFANKGKTATAVITLLYTLSYGVCAITSFIPAVTQFIHYITIVFEYGEPEYLIVAITSCNYAARISTVTFGLMLTTVIAFVCARSKTGKSFVLKLWVLPLIVFIFTLLGSFSNVICDVLDSAVFNSTVSAGALTSSLVWGLSHFIGAVAHILLVIYFARLASYKRKLAAYEANAPIETTADEVTAPAVNAAPEAEIPTEAPLAEETPAPENDPHTKGTLLRLQQLHDTGALTKEELEALKSQL